MRSRALRGVLAGALVLGFPMEGWLAATPVEAKQAKSERCRLATLIGEVREGGEYRRLIGNGLAVILQPIASGWILRVIPAAGSPVEHDYAELATPPYNSVTPLSISTDFSFRAQDAIGWNPREFGFAMDRRTYTRLLEAYGRLGGAGSTPSPAAEQETVGLLARTAHGRLRILDARLAPGSADQWRGAGAVASHFNSTAHTVDDSAKPSALGKILWMRFQIELEAPDRFPFDRSIRLIPSACSV